MWLLPVCVKESLSYSVNQKGHYLAFLKGILALSLYFKSWLKSGSANSNQQTWILGNGQSV